MTTVLQQLIKQTIQEKRLLEEEYCKKIFKTVAPYGLNTLN